MRNRRKHTYLATLIVAAALSASHAYAQVPPVFGDWATQGYGSLVGLAPCARNRATICGEIRWLWRASDTTGQPRRDNRNPDPTHRARPLVGVEILQGFRETAPNVFTGGTIYNPDDGRTYTGTIRLRQDALYLQGCALGVFCQTQVWRRPDSLPAGAKGGRS